MVSKWIEHVKAYCAKHGCSYKEGLSRASASYKPMKMKGGMDPERNLKMLADVASTIVRLPVQSTRDRSLARLRRMSLPELRALIDRGTASANLTQLIREVIAEKEMTGGVNRMKKAKKWTDFAVDTAKKGIGLAKEVKGMMGGMKRNRTPSPDMSALELLANLAPEPSRPRPSTPDFAPIKKANEIIKKAYPRIMAKINRSSFETLNDMLKAYTEFTDPKITRVTNEAQRQYIIQLLRIRLGSMG